MRSRIVPVCVALLLSPLAGCNWFHDNILSKNKSVASNDEKPTKEKLISYLNRNAEQLDSIQVNNLGIEAKMGLGVARSIALSGTMQAKKPRNFRLEGYLPGAKSDLVDLGSNEREFWFWVGADARASEAPYLYHCSHTDLPKAQLPLPIHPDWIMEALGMATVVPSPNIRLEFARDGKTMELIEPTRSPQNQPMYKVTVFNARNVTGTEPQVLARKLVDARGKTICIAEIKAMQLDPHSKILVPHKIDLVYPSDRKMDEIALSLVLDTIAVNQPVDPAMAQVWFNRPNKPGIVALDLGRQGGNSSLRAPGGPSLGSPIIRGLRR